MIEDAVQKWMKEISTKAESYGKAIEEGDRSEEGRKRKKQLRTADRDYIYETIEFIHDGTEYVSRFLFPDSGEDIHGRS